jgi:hypothetical protein
MPALTEADTCRRYVLPKLYASGWTDDHINEQRTFTDSISKRQSRKPKQKCDTGSSFATDTNLLRSVPCDIG